jgi:predicted metal-dependent phosphoesterase TrpH
MRIKVDFHTHSIASPDGSLTAKDYRRMLEGGGLDVIAVTDHNRVDFALDLQRELGDRIIVGEEISTSEGEIIGLFLHKAVPAGLQAAETIALIRKQRGLVYIPHPFETVRSGVSREVLDSVAWGVDIIEVQNGRAMFQDKSKEAFAWAKQHTVAAAAASDAHGKNGWGKTYTTLSAKPDRQNLLGLLHNARRTRAFPGALALLYPKFNRVLKKLRGGKYA